MTNIAVTEQGTVTGTNRALVAAAAAVVAKIPSPARPSDSRIDSLVAAVRIPWARVPVSG